MEHVPQESIGGVILCLTCRKCNSRAGHKYEGMMRYEPQSRFLIGSIPIRGSFGSGEDLLRGMWSIGAGGVLDFKVIAGMNDARRLPGIEQKRKLLRRGSVIEASWQMKYSQDKVNVGHLKNAYLAAFAQFGYELVKSSAYDVVREQIDQPDQEMIRGYKLYCTNNHPIERGVFVTRSPFRTVICKWDSSAVFLPTAEDKRADIYKWINDHVSVPGALNFIVEEGYVWPRKASFLAE